MATVRTRFAPSPTGYLHIGGVRTALFCWLFARRHKGEYILRIEDTDVQRSTPEATSAILDGLAWLGLGADDEPVFQSRRFDRYREVADKLHDKGQAYYCYCTKNELDQVRKKQISKGEKPRYNGHCRDRTEPRHPDVSPVLRFRTPRDGEVVFDDRVHGKITVHNRELDDFIILRSDGTPTYNFTVVADDRDMRISHVIRGDDHINNTPRQIHIFNALGAEIPQFAHLPMINGPDGQKLSKRHGAVSVLEYRQQGFLPQGLLNYLARLGWSHGDQELFSIDELIEYFDLEDVNKSAASFDMEKLLWTNQQHIRQADAGELATALAEQYAATETHAASGPDLEDIAEVYRDKAPTMKEMAAQSSWLFTGTVTYQEQAVGKFFNADGARALHGMRQALSALEDWQTQSINTAVKAVVNATGLKFPQVAQPLRIALTGGTNSPSIDQTLWLAGRETSLDRIDCALEYIE